GARESRIRGAALRHAGSEARRARHDRAARLEGPRGAAGAGIVRWLEAAARARRLHPAEPATAVARRADRRRRPQGAARVLERDPRTRRRGADRAGLDPLHGRGRALSRDRLHRLRPPPGARHCGRSYRALQAHDLHRGRSRPAAAAERARGQARRRHGRAVRHQPTCVGARRKSAGGDDRAVSRTERSGLAQVGAVAGRRVHRADGAVKGQFPMSVTTANNDGGNGGLGGFLRRTYAMLAKEFIQLRRDRGSFAMIIAIPVMRLLLFVYAINTTPHHMPTAVLVQEDSDLSRSILKALENTNYFKFTRQVHTELEFDDLFLTGQVLFGVEIPRGFERA